MEITLKINFTDFWENFDKTDNFFFDLLSKHYLVEISDNPDYLFYSCYGNEFFKYDCIRIFYTSENLRPDFLQCDYALSFDFLKRNNHFRLPLYHLYIQGHNYYPDLVKEISREEATAIWKTKTKFCCMLVSNSNSEERINFFKALSKIKKVDSGGRFLNNIGYSVVDKMAFIKDYKFVFAFENSKFAGYTTEKILEPFVVNSIPIYWGNKMIDKDFNRKSFINVNDFNNYESLISKLIEIDRNDELAIEMIVQNKIAIGGSDHLVLMNDVLQFLFMIINRRVRIPASRNNFFLMRIFIRTNIQKLKVKIIATIRGFSSFLHFKIL